MREMTRFVATRLDGLLQPRNGLVELAEFDHVCANVVIGIAKIGIEFDGALALGDGVQQFALKVIGPAEKRMRFGGRMKIERRVVEFDRPIVITFHLCLIGVLQHFPGASQRLLIHEAIVEGKTVAGQRYEGSICAKTPPVLSDGVQWKFGHRIERIKDQKQNWQGNGGNVNRIATGISVVLICGALAGGALFAQDSAKKTGGANAAAVARGKSLFQQKCSVCHYDTSDQKKIGPGLKGISKRGTFSVNGNKITDDSLKTWIENGDQLMPPFKDVLEPAQVKDVIAYVKTL